MTKKYLLTSLCVVIVGMTTTLFAGETEIKLKDSTASSVFSVKDGTDNTLLRVQGDGSVGIGTTITGRKLSVNGSIGVIGPSLNEGVMIATTGLPSATPGNSSWLMRANSDAAPFNGQSGSLSFERWVGVVPNTALLLSSTGNVGIGTINPNTLLHIDGTGVDNNGLTAVVRIVSGNGAQNLLLDGNEIDATADGLFLNNNTNQNIVLANGGGNVGIGTTNPQGKLDVNGSIFQRGASLHADYVFESDYNLESIDAHSEFMWQNKHLKAIPKAEIDENGMEIVEVGSHQKGIVEELEKAHIYIEQLHKRNNELENKHNPTSTT